MFKNFKSKLKKRMERWSKKQLKICKICLWIVIIFLMISLFGTSLILRKSAMNVDDQIMIFILKYLIFVILFWPSAKILFMISSIQRKNRTKEQEDNYFSDLQNVLSTTEYRKVLYSPNLRRYSCNSTVSYEDDELAYCLNLLRNDGIIHYAIIDGDCVRVISKNTAGKQIGHRTISATEFCKNYEVIEE